MSNMAMSNMAMSNMSNMAMSKVSYFPIAGILHFYNHTNESIQYFQEQQCSGR